MNFGKAFTFVFDDQDWIKKVAINALIGLIPIVGQIYLLGWGLEVARRIVMRDGTPLPDVDFGKHLGHGFKAFVIGLVYSIPIWIIMIPVAIVPVLGEAIDMDYDTVATVSMICSVCGGLLTLVYALFLGIAMPAAMTRSVLQGSVGAGLKVGEVIALVRAAPGAYLMVLLGGIVASLLASIVGAIACGIGIIFTMAYYQVVLGHFYGQAYLQAAGAGSQGPSY